MAEPVTGSNIPPLRLHVPEPRFRPGDTADFSNIEVPPVDAIPCPDTARPAAELRPLAYGLVRVLDDDGVASGSWNPHLTPETQIQILRDMLLLRHFDDRLFRAQRQGKTSFYVKSLGEEAIACAAARALAADDMCFPSYRQQGLLIARGWPLVEMINQIYSNKGDRLMGRQMPLMHSVPEKSFFTLSGNLATQLPQAVGWAMASAAQGDTRIAAAWCGEGSTAEGDFHSAMTFAAVYHAPVIINVVNNQWAISSYSGFAGGDETTFAARAIGYGIAGLRVDGNDALAVFAATRWATERARSSHGPTMIEFFTYRVEGHSTSDDPTQYRPAGEGQAWPLGDPIERLSRHLIHAGHWDAARHDALSAATRAEVMAAIREAETNGVLGQGLLQPLDSMFDDVFAELPWHLREQRDQLRAEAGER